MWCCYVRVPLLSDWCWQSTSAPSGLYHVQCDISQKPKPSKVLCCLHSVHLESAASALHLHPKPHCEESLLCLSFRSYLCQQPCKLSSHLSSSSLAQLHFHGAALYSSVSIATLTDMQQVTVSRGTECSSPLLVARPALRGSDWPTRPSGLMVFTEMKS